MQNLLEMENQISFSCEDKSQSTTTYIKVDKQSTNKEKKQNVYIKVLKENIQNQEKDKIKNKYQKELQIKNDQIFQISKKLQKVEEQLTKSTALVNKLSNQNLLEKQKNKDLGREIQKYKNKQKQNESKQPTQTQLTQMKRIQKENSELNHKIAQMEKENKIIVRRMINQSEEIKKNLQGKLQVKNKQQLKVQEMLQRKKQEFIQLINEKDNQITQYTNKITNKEKMIRHLNECLQEAKIKFTKMEVTFNEFAQKNKNELDVLRQTNEMLKAQLSNLQTKQSQYQTKIVASLQCFQKHFEPTSIMKQPLQIVENLKQLMIAKFQQKKNQMYKLQKNNQQLSKIEIQLRQNINAQQQQIKKLSFAKNQAQEKSDRQQQELKFLKQREKNTVNFADIIRQHLQNRQESVKKKEERSQKKETDCKLKYKVTYDSLPQKRQITSQITKKSPRSNSQITRKQNINTRQSLIVRSQQKQKNIQKLSSTQLINLKKAHYDNVISELSHKKQSLIFLMYQGQNKKQIAPNINKKYIKTQQPKSVKRRSSSMSELVRQRCQTSTLNLHD